MLHYNFPGFATGECKRDMSPGRREIGHGNLARRALMPLLPPEEDFGYTIRVVSDITESNGSSSMPEGINISVEDFRAALKLILERRRVSQDLLKAHFGSSARATNILSVLEIQGFIHKPEGSNKWEIFFDKIEHQLSLLDSQNMLQSPEESQPQEEDEP